MDFKRDDGVWLGIAFYTERMAWTKIRHGQYGENLWEATEVLKYQCEWHLPKEKSNDWDKNQSKTPWPAVVSSTEMQ